MQRKYILFFTGLVCIGISLGLFSIIFVYWVFPFAPTGYGVSLQSAVLMIYFCLISIVTGIVGGFLIGKYYELIQ